MFLSADPDNNLISLVILYNIKIYAASGRAKMGRGINEKYSTIYYSIPRPIFAIVCRVYRIKKSHKTSDRQSGIQNGLPVLKVR